VNRNVAIFLGLAAVVAVGVGSALTGIGGSAVNRWTLMAGIFVVLGVSRLVVGAVDRRQAESAADRPAERSGTDLDRELKSRRG
jgi:hypothetical protein